MRLLPLVVLCGLGLASLASAQGQRAMPDDVGGIPEEKAFKEDAVSLPAFPRDADLIEFKVRGPSRNRFHVDPGSLSLGEDRVVRYALVIKTPGGSSNVSYEGMRCKTSEYKVYAYGSVDGKWVAAREPQWKEVGATPSNFHYGLWVDYFCGSESVRGRNAADLIANLKGVSPYRSNTTKE